MRLLLLLLLLVIVFIVVWVTAIAPALRTRRAARQSWTMHPRTLEDGRRQIIFRRVTDPLYKHGTEEHVFRTVPPASADPYDALWDETKLDAEEELRDWNKMLKRDAR